MGVNKVIESNTLKNKFVLFTGNNNFNLVANARKGIGSDVFYDFAALIKMSEKNLAQIIHLSTRTISNYKANKKSLEPLQSEHLLKLISLYQLGEELFGNLDEFNYWLQKPFWNRPEKPIEWLITPGGVDLVRDELMRLAYGDAL